VSELLNPAFWTFVGVVAGIFTIFALGLQLQYGFTGLLNFGHVAFMALAAYTMAILVIQVEVPMPVAALIAIGVAMAFGILIGWPTVRLRGDYLAIATIAFGEIVRYLAINLHGLTGGPQGTILMLGPGQAATYNTEWTRFQASVQGLLERLIGDVATRGFTMLVIVWTLAIVLIWLLQVAVRSPWGRVLRSIREDEDAAAVLGKNITWYKLQSMAIGSGLGGLAGLLYAYQFAFFSPSDFEPLVTFFAYVIVILGGTARNWAVPVGAVLFGVIFAGTRFLNVPPLTYFDAAGRASLRLIIIGLLLIGLMAFRPQGLFGKREEMLLG
jgi:branched-chain amino acid transport system permease protein